MAQMMLLDEMRRDFDCQPGLLTMRPRLVPQVRAVLEQRCASKTNGIARRMGEGMTLKHKHSQLLFAYWNSVRGIRMAPRRFDIEPGRLGDVLPETFILERTATDQLIYRLAGTKLCDSFGLDLRGRDFLQELSPSDRAKLEPQLESVIAQGAVLLQHLEIGNQDGLTGTLEVLLLPLTHTQSTIDRFVGCMVWLSSPFDVKSPKLTLMKLVSSQLIWPEGPPIADPARHLDPARQAPFLPHIRNARIVRQDRRQFRVYDGGLTKPPADKH